MHVCIDVCMYVCMYVCMLHCMCVCIQYIFTNGSVHLGCVCGEDEENPDVSLTGFDLRPTAHHDVETHYYEQNNLENRRAWAFCSVSGTGNVIQASGDSLSMFLKQKRISCMYVCMYVCVYVCVYVLMYVCMYVCVCRMKCFI